jgi:hypothetical protein
MIQLYNHFLPERHFGGIWMVITSAGDTNTRPRRIRSAKRGVFEVGQAFLRFGSSCWICVTEDMEIPWHFVLP